MAIKSMTYMKAYVEYDVHVSSIKLSEGTEFLYNIIPRRVYMKCAIFVGFFLAQLWRNSKSQCQISYID